MVNLASDHNTAVDPAATAAGGPAPVTTDGAAYRIALGVPRQDLHNASVDDEVAHTGRCAQVHLPTGAICGLEHHHPNSCDFVRQET